MPILRAVSSTSSFSATSSPYVPPFPTPSTSTPPERGMCRVSVAIGARSAYASTTDICRMRLMTAESHSSGIQSSNVCRATGLPFR